MFRHEKISLADYDKAREYLRDVLSNKKVANSSASGLLIKATMDVFGSLQMGAHFVSLDEAAQLRVYHVECVARALKRRQDPSGEVSRLVLDAATTSLAHIPRGGTRGDLAAELRSVHFRSVAAAESEKIVAPISAWLRRLKL